MESTTYYRCIVCGAIGPFSLWYNTNHEPGINLVRMCDYCGPEARGFIRDDLNKYGAEV